MGKRDLQFNVTEVSDGTVRLEQAILLYGASRGGSFATVHKVHLDANGSPTILPGKAMTAVAVAALAKKLSRRREGGFVPPNLLYQDGSTFAWWAPSMRRQVWFRGDAAKLGAAERSEVVPHPGLVFAVSANRTWRVWAVKGAERPQADTEVFRAPYWNVWETHAICVGNVDTPRKADPDGIPAWEDAFFRSYFTHPNGNSKLVNYRGGAYGFWRDMLDGRHHEFPERVLISTGSTLEKALKDNGRG